MGANNCPKKSVLSPTKRVQCLGFHKTEVWFRGSTYRRFCPACTSKMLREPGLPRAAVPIRSALYDDF